MGDDNELSLLLCNLSNNLVDTLHDPDWFLGEDSVLAGSLVLCLLLEAQHTSDFGLRAVLVQKSEHFTS